MKKYYFLVLGLLVFSGVKSQINFPDANFKAKLLTASSSNSVAKDLSGKNIVIDINNDGEIQESEAQNVGELNINFSNISSLVGISNFNNLISLNCYDNKLTTLDLTSLEKLKLLKCYSNQLTSLNLQGLVNLQELDCNSNQLILLNLQGLVSLKVLNLSSNKFTLLNLRDLVNLEILNCYSNYLTSLGLEGLLKLKTLFCVNNQFTSLNLNGLTNLESIFCYNNYQLTSLNLRGLVNLKILDCRDSQLAFINLEGLVNLYNLNCSGNQFTTLDVTGLPKLLSLDCTFNQNLKSLFLKGTEIGPFRDIFIGNENLRYICTNEKDISSFFLYFFNNGIKGINVNSYCSFNPGGTFYTIQGTDKYDSNNNGCDVLDLSISNSKFSIADGTNTGSVIANTTGNYVIPVQAGTHTVTPVVENSGYFLVSPANTVVTFPIQASPFTQDFCVTANGIHPDLEVSALPITRARAGFDASYKISYKNKGTQTQSGSVNLTFNDAILDLVTSSPIATTQSTNNLSWNFTNLKPFETREIAVKVNVNGPMETPAVNGGDTLDFTTTIASTLTDETPADNTFTLNQTVVNAFDPNDKTCLEGATIPPSAVGKYVHYMIRFENKGTAEAQNVVVKDMIDTSKFDVSSLVVTQGSHPFVTRISETNKVEFIFENINLPFDDATNDGYVAFKIKTKPSLVVGNSFSNTASIYFDYNFPIVTNTATTSVLQSLGLNDFEFDSYFKIYPNPAKNSLNLDVKKQINVSSISIYNTLGQQILVIPNAQYTKQVDVSNLKTGNYFIKLTSDKGSSVGKFIKS